MDSNLIDEMYVRQAAAAMDIPLSSAHLPGVVMYFRMIAGFAETVNAFPLNPDVEIAPVFAPCSPTTPAQSK